MPYPDWVEAQRKPGTNISSSRGKFYLYECSSVWDKQKGRARKVTGKYLGRITPEGLIPPKKKKDIISSPISVKEFGVSNFLINSCSDILFNLRKFFPQSAELLFSLAALRLVESAPFKRMEHFYYHSFMSEVFGPLKLSGKDISSFIRDFGDNRVGMVLFMDQYISGHSHIIFDVTNIISKSDMAISRVGYNSNQEYDPQINLLYAFSTDLKSPIYYRIVPGNIRDITAFKLSVEETELNDMVMIADKGFGSQSNFDLLEESNLKYIIPLKRSSSLFDDTVIRSGDRANYEGYFMFKDRAIWYYSSEDNKVVVYVDSQLKTKEEKDYLRRISENIEGYSYEGFIKKQHSFGAIILKTNLKESAEEIYCIYKTRQEIEQTFDFLKNLLEQDNSYMQNEKALESWAFITHIALLMNYKIYNLIKSKKLISRYSIADFIAHLKYIHKIKVNDSWVTTEITKKTAKLLEELDIPIT